MNFNYQKNKLNTYRRINKGHIVGVKTLKKYDLACKNKQDYFIWNTYLVQEVTKINKILNRLETCSKKQRKYYIERYKYVLEMYKMWDDEIIDELKYLGLSIEFEEVGELEELAD